VVYPTARIAWSVLVPQVEEVITPEVYCWKTGCEASTYTVLGVVKIACCI